MGVIVGAMGVSRRPLACFLGVYRDWGARWVWSAMIFSMAIQGLLMSLRFRLGERQTLKG